MRDLLVIVALTLGTCAVVGALGAGLLHLVRRRSLRYQLVLAALLPVLAVAATVLVNVHFMLLSAHDSAVVSIALLTAVVLAAAGAWLVLRRITSAAAQVGAGVSALVRDSRREADRGGARPAPGSGAGEVPEELAHVLDDLAAARQTLAESRARERAAEQARQDLVTFMSHDLRTPLAGLRALAEGLEDQVITDVPRALSHLRATVARMTGLVDDLFALSRVQGAHESKPATLVSLTELIGDIAAESAATARAQGVQLHVELPEDDRLAVYGSAEDLARALTNLAANAIRHTDAGSAVRFEAGRDEDGHVRVAVIDACGGIPDAYLSRVFETGWRGTASRTGDDGGAGLGLAITRGVVESHAGQIAVRNVSGGCRFEVALPAPAAAAGGDRP